MPGRAAPRNAVAPWVYDEAQARRDLGELQALLAPGVPLQEARDILPFVADHADLFCLLAGYNNQEGRYPLACYARDGRRSLARRWSSARTDVGD